MFIDLHLHSNVSDGVLSPKGLVKFAKKNNFSVISIADHNTIDGLSEALGTGQKFKIKIVPGLEISSHFRGFVFHLLGYNFDLENKELNQALKRLQEEHIKDVRKFLEYLKSQNWKIDFKDFQNSPSSYLGHAEIFWQMKKRNWMRIKKDFKLKKGQRLLFSEVYNKYFKKGEKHLLEEATVPAFEAIKLIKRANGIAVLAHPGKSINWQKAKIIIPLLKKFGLDGIEAISPSHNWPNIEYWQNLAKELKLIITTGSDFHGQLPDQWNFPISHHWQYFRPLNKNLSSIF